MTEAYANIGRCPAKYESYISFSYIGIPMEVTIKANTGVIRVQMRSDAQQLDYTSENLFPFTKSNF